MRGPLLNMSPGLGASNVDMEYRRSSQGTTIFILHCNYMIVKINDFFFFPFLFSHKSVTLESCTNTTIATILQTT